MKKILSVAFASATMLALSACGSTTDASEEAMAENVEMPADEAMTANVVEEPVATPADDAAAEAVTKAEDAADATADTANAAAAAADDAAAAAADAAAAAQ